MVTRGSEEVRRLLLRGWWFPEESRNGIGVCRLGNLSELERVLGGAWLVDVLRGRMSVGI